MSKRGAGVAFCCIAAFLYAARYIAAAIFGSGVSSWSTDLFQAMYSYVGSGLTIAAAFALAIGIVYLINAEAQSTLLSSKWWRNHVREKGSTDDNDWTV